MYRAAPWVRISPWPKPTRLRPGTQFRPTTFLGMTLPKMRLLCLSALLLVAVSTADAQQRFLRGDASANGIVDVEDPIVALAAVFGAGSVFCFDAFDADDNGQLEIADPILILQYLFVGGPPPSPPFPCCGPDLTSDSLDCPDPIAACSLSSSLSPMLFPEQLRPALGAVTTGDFNNDGILDLISANASVSLGQGDGTFSLIESGLPHGDGDGIGIGDFDSDGRLDVIMVTEPWTVSLLPGVGDGTFSPPIHLPVFAAAIQSIAVGDFNLDGDLDFAVAHGLTFAGMGQEFVTLSVRLGSGAGAFDDPIQYAVGLGALDAIATADFDRDGVLDLVVGSSGPLLGTLRGNGDGTFGDPVWAASNPARELRTFDFDNDGNPDVLLSSLAGQTQIHFGLGDGTFGPPTTVEAGALIVADLDSDGVLDITAGRRVRFGLGDGTFEDGPLFGAIPIAAGDFDCDGILDLNAGSAGTFFGRGSRDYDGAALGLDSGWVLATADIDGDGTLDLLGVAQDQLQALIGLGNGTFAPAVEFPTGAASSALGVGDLNNDGAVDAVMANEDTGEIVALLGSGAGSFGLPQPIVTQDGALAVLLDDFDQDGTVDLIVHGAELLFYRGNGDATFAAAQVIGEDSVYFPAVLTRMSAADLNADGNLDLVHGAYNHVSVLLGNGDGTFDGGTVTGEAGHGFFSPVVADFNEDGVFDLAVGNTNSLLNQQMLFGVGDGSFIAGPPLQPDGYSSIGATAAADLNGDGFTDLATVSTYNEIRIYLGNGDGMFDSALEYSSRYSIGFHLLIRDLDGDGWPDMIATDAVYLNQSD